MCYRQIIELRILSFTPAQAGQVTQRIHTLSSTTTTHRLQRVRWRLFGWLTTAWFVSSHPFCEKSSEVSSAAFHTK